MSPRSLVNLTLLMVVAALVLVTVLEPGIEKPSQPKPLDGLEPDVITLVRIERAGRDPLLFERREGQWWISAPLDLPANGHKLRSLLELPRATSLQAFALDDVELTEAGLDQPKAVLQLNQRVFTFGGTEPLNGTRYVRLGDRVHLITDRFFHHLIASPAAFVSPYLLPPGARPEVINLPGNRLRLGDNGWRVEPDRPDLSADRIADLVQAWRDAQALAVRTYQAPPDGTEVRDISVFLRGQKRPLRFQLHNQGRDSVFARPEAGVEYQMAPEMAARLLDLVQDTVTDEETASEPRPTPREAADSP